MLTSLSRYTFQPQHFVLAHDVALDNNMDQNEDNNFDFNKENDKNFTWNFPSNSSSNLFHSSNNSLESLNRKNAVKSKLGTRQVSLQEQIKKHKIEAARNAVHGLRIEDFAKIGTDCVRLNLDGLIIGRQNVNRRNISKIEDREIVLRPITADPEQQTKEPIPSNDDETVQNETAFSRSRRSLRRLPEIPKNHIQQRAHRLSGVSVPASSLIRVPSLAEELKAALEAENHAANDKSRTANDESHVANNDFNRFSLCLGISHSTPNADDLGSPDQIDPVKKYEDLDLDFRRDRPGAEEVKPCRKSCCLSDSVPLCRQQPQLNGWQKKDFSGDTLATAAAAAAADDDDDDGGDGVTTDTSKKKAKRKKEMMRLDVDAKEMDEDEDEDADVFDDDSNNDLIQSSVLKKEASLKSGLLNNVGSFENSLSKKTPEDSKSFEDCQRQINADFYGPLEVKTLDKNTGSAGGGGGGGSGDMVDGSDCVDYDLDEMDATHRGCHKFVPRHSGELEIEIGDFVFVEMEHDDLWCEGVNLRTKRRGIFPTAYAMDLSLFDDVDRGSKFFVKYLGSIEVNLHKGNDVLCQAINKLVSTRRRTMEANPPSKCRLEITEHGVKMTDRSKKTSSLSAHHFMGRSSLKEKIPTANDHLFLLKNISFCGYHPKNDKYLGFITKHPLEMRFACHVFQSDKSTKVIAEAIGEAFRKFYQEYLAFVYPTEDIYLE